MAGKKKKVAIRQAKQDRAKDTIEAILTATTQILISDGYEKATTNRIAAIAGVSIGSVYQYFPDKAAIMAELIERKLVSVMRKFVEKLAVVRELPLAEGAPALIRTLIEARSVHVGLRRVYDEQIPKVGKLGRLRELEGQATELVYAYLVSRKSELRVKNVAVAAYVAVQAVEGLVHVTLSERPELAENGEFESEVVDLMLRYLLKT